MQKILAVTTYNRLNCLKKMIASFFKYTKNTNQWTIIFADDGSTDGTKEFIDSFASKNIVKIYNQRSGISNQTNSIFSNLQKFDDFICFKADDDMLFIDNGWDNLYINAIYQSGFQHLCFDHYLFNQFGENKKAVYEKPINRNSLLARIPSIFVKGCFYTVTNSILKSVGYMDSNVFFHGLEHVDYSMRCARCGFNDINNIFDAENSDRFLSYRFPFLGEDVPSLNNDIYRKNGNDKFETEIKKKILIEQRTFIGYNFNEKKMIDDIKFL
jgi:glycosyltransferase involved in cell wall biosynthesis